MQRNFSLQKLSPFPFANSKQIPTFAMRYILRKARWLANIIAAGIFYVLSLCYINL